VRSVVLCGTRYTMEHGFYRDRLAARSGAEVRIPSEADRIVMHDIIYSELIHGVVTNRSRVVCLDIIGRLIEDGAQGLIAG
jgi:aspartate racemase